MVEGTLHSLNIYRLKRSINVLVTEPVAIIIGNKNYFLMIGFRKLVTIGFDFLDPCLRIV